ncbi:MAG TPA: hypothetical protein VEI06_12700 [Gemmatimonadaceae bacterium]|nr:hypothetical protein [Gemmatimonadaceae bacterium]
MKRRTWRNALLPLVGPSVRRRGAPLAAITAVACLLTATAARGQSRPFVFTITTAPPSPTHRWSLEYDAGYAERTDDPFGFDGVEQRLAAQGALGAGFTLLAQVGVGLGGEGAETMGQIEVLKDLLGADRDVNLSIGMGARHEWEGATDLLGRIVVGHTFARSSLFGNVNLEKSFAADRDDIDIITTLGYLHRLTASIHGGVELVAEDLEGLWEANEAEGGAKVFVGPTIHVAPPRSRFYFSLSGGPILYATHSSGTSEAPRPLGAQSNGYTIRLTLGYGL